MSSGGDIKVQTGKLISGTYDYTIKYIKKGVLFMMVFIIFCGNLFALSLSLQCNRSEPINIKIASALFAFSFGFLYILVNYYQYRIIQQGYPCIISDKHIFSF